MILTSLVLNLLLRKTFGATSGHWFGKKKERQETGVLLYKTGNSMSIKITILLRCQMYDFISLFLM